MSGLPNQDDNSEEIVENASSENPSNNRHYEIAIKKLREIRDKITKAGKYSERYKDTFTREVPDDNKFPLSAQCRDTMELYRKVSKGEKSDNSPNVSLKHLTTEKMKLPTSKSNATNDLNKQENVLIGFKLVPEGTLKHGLQSSPLTPPKTPKWNKRLKDVNIYHVTSSSSPPSNSIQPSTNASASSTATNNSVTPGFSAKPTMVQLSTILSTPSTNSDANTTMTHLQNVESIISKLDEKEKIEANLRKFEDMVKKFAPKPPPTKPATVIKEHPKISQEHIIEKQVENNFELSKKFKTAKPQEHILDPLKTCSEVEDLQGKGLSDNESDHQEQHFKREGKERKSLDHGTKEKPINTGLNRTASDAQDKTLNTLTKRRTMKDRTRKVRSFILIIKICKVIVSYESCYVSSSYIFYIDLIT